MNEILRLHQSMLDNCTAAAVHLVRYIRFTYYTQAAYAVSAGWWLFLFATGTETFTPRLLMGAFFLVAVYAAVAQFNKRVELRADLANWENRADKSKVALILLRAGEIDEYVAYHQRHWAE